MVIDLKEIQKQFIMKSSSLTINGENSHLGFQKVKQSARSGRPSPSSLLFILISGPASSPSSG